MTRGHFRAFLSLACGILQVENGFEIGPYPILFSVSLLSLSPLAKVKKKEQTLVHCCCHFFLPFTSNLPALFVFNPGPKAFVGRKRT